jgi:uridine kinase
VDARQAARYTPARFSSFIAEQFGVSARLPFVVAISGGSGSGKTTIARAVIEALKPREALLVPEDDYYRDNRHEPGFDAATYDFDDPAARDHALLAEHLAAWRSGKTVEKPVYDFTTHGRLDQTQAVAAPEVLVFEGTHALVTPSVASLANLRVFVDAPADVRVLRRLLRDVSERGRTIEGGVQQYMRTARPGHLKHTEPSRGNADLVVSGGIRIGEPEADGLHEAVSTIRDAIFRRMDV